MFKAPLPNLEIHSDRSARMGSIDAARRAGSAAAKSIKPINTIPAVPNSQTGGCARLASRLAKIRRPAHPASEPAVNPATKSQPTRFATRPKT
jgi:hypothetical protein